MRTDLLSRERGVHPPWSWKPQRPMEVGYPKVFIRLKVYIYIYIYTYVYLSIYLSIYLCIYTCIRTRIKTYIFLAPRLSEQGSVAEQLDARASPPTLPVARREQDRPDRDGWPPEPNDPPCSPFAPLDRDRDWQASF